MDLDKLLPALAQAQAAYPKIGDTGGTMAISNPSAVYVATALWKYAYNVSRGDRANALIAKRFPGKDYVDHQKWEDRLANNPTPFGSMDGKTMDAYLDCALEWFGTTPDIQP